MMHVPLRIFLWSQCEVLVKVNYCTKEGSWRERGIRGFDQIGLSYLYDTDPAGVQ